MSEDEDVQMNEDAPIQWPSSKGKGKEKAVEHTEGHDPENLPW